MREITVTHSWCRSPYHSGPRWLQAIEFYRNNRRSDGLQTYCKTCSAIQNREQRQKSDFKKKEHERSREYKAARRRREGVPVRRLKNPSGRYGEGRVLQRDATKLDARAVHDFVVAMRTVEVSSKTDKEYFINGISLWEQDRRYLSSLRTGGVATVSLQKADTMAHRYQFSLDELIDASTL